MKLNFRVHSVVATDMTRKVTFEGEEMVATIPSLEVELTWDNVASREHGSQTLRFVGSDMDEARHIFVVDQDIQVEYSNPPASKGSSVAP